MTATEWVAEQRLALAIEAARLGCWTWDMDSGRTTWDERLEEMHGLAPGGFGGRFEDWVEAIHPDDRADCLARVQAALEHPGPYMLSHRTVWEDGSVHSIECRGTVLVDDVGKPIGTTGVAIDVTLRDRHEASITRALEHEQRLVQTLQRALLAPSFPPVPGTKVAARYVAAETNLEIGGDWYAVLPVEGNALGLAIGDVAGHGLDAVADMAAVRFSLRALALVESAPDEVLARLNHLVGVFSPETMITALYGVLDPRRRVWSYARAGNCPAMLRHPDGTTIVLDAPGDPPLGVASAFRVHSVPMSEGATLVLYTDGLVERRNESIATGIDRLRQACRDGPRDPEALCDHLVHAMLPNSSNEDDAALVVVNLPAEAG
jgi:PAS domain S-box-containing protein